MRKVQMLLTRVRYKVNVPRVPKLKIDLCGSG